MTRRIRITIDGAERTIQTRWSGDAWRTEREHKPTSTGVGNVADKSQGPLDVTVDRAE